MWKFLINIFFKFLGFEIDEEILDFSEEKKITNDQNITEESYFSKKKIILILLLMIFFGISYYILFNIETTENIWDQLKNCTDTETFNKIYQHVQNIYENPYFRQKDLNILRFIQLETLLKYGNNEEFKNCMDNLFEQIEKDLKDVKKYTSYK